MVADPLQVGAKLALNGRREKAAEVRASAFFGGPPQAFGRCRIHKEEIAVEVVDAHEAQALLHEAAEDLGSFRGQMGAGGRVTRSGHAIHLPPSSSRG